MNFLRLFLALAMWPGIYATAVFLGKVLRGAFNSPSFQWMGSAIFGAGLVVAWAAFFFLPRPRGFYVLGHELTHALAVWLSGGRVHSLHVADQGGKVVADRVSPWINLAPYILPFYPMVVGILWLAGTRIWPDLNNYGLPFLGIWGAIWGYHYAFTLGLIPTCQPDFLAYGRIFSLTLIIFGNLIVAGILAWSAFRPFPAGQTLLMLGSEWAWTYTQLVYWLSGLLLRYMPHPA
ncbi:MAG: hypothetical protein NTZ01_03085 [Verrucomicrobia bacterium]|nr:hypothetical protein [Verrucomicrobiota bacterium]